MPQQTTAEKRQKANYRVADSTPCGGCNGWVNNTVKLECTKECKPWHEYVKSEKSCWTCQSFIIGYGCVADAEQDPFLSEVDWVCDDWEKEV